MGGLFSQQKIQQYPEYPDILFPDSSTSDTVSCSSSTCYDINEQQQKINEMEKDANETWRLAKEWENDFNELERKISEFIPELASTRMDNEETNQLRKDLARLRDMRTIIIQQDRMLNKRMEHLIVGIECEASSQVVNHSIMELKKELDPNTSYEETEHENGNAIKTMDNNKNHFDETGKFNGFVSTMNSKDDTKRKLENPYYYYGSTSNQKISSNVLSNYQRPKPLLPSHRQTLELQVEIGDKNHFNLSNDQLNRMREQKLNVQYDQPDYHPSAPSPPLHRLPEQCLIYGNQQTHCNKSNSGNIDEIEVYELYKHLQITDEDDYSIAEGVYGFFLESDDEDDAGEDWKNANELADKSFTKQYQDQKKERLRSNIGRNQKRILAMWRRNARTKSRVDQLYYTLQTLKKKNHDLTIELTKMFYVLIF